MTGRQSYTPNQDMHFSVAMSLCLGPCHLFPLPKSVKSVDTCNEKARPCTYALKHNKTFVRSIPIPTLCFYFIHMIKTRSRYKSHTSGNLQLDSSFPQLRKPLEKRDMINSNKMRKGFLPKIIIPGQ